MRQSSTRPTNLTAILVWLRSRLLPGGADALMLAAYGMLLTALITFVLLQTDLSSTAYYGGILILTTMFVLHVILPDLGNYLGEYRANLIHLVVNGFLWLAASWLIIGTDEFSFVPFLIYMLVVQAVVNLPVRLSSAYVAILMIALISVFYVKNVSSEEIILSTISLSTGLLFVITFSYVLNLYRAQTERAQVLLTQLTAANIELEEARIRKQELAVAEERVRIARDIHDGLGHHLTALNVQLQAAARLIERDPVRAAKALATSREVARAALDEVRQSVATMRKTPLDNLGLPEALAALCQDFARHTGLQIDVQMMGTPFQLSSPAAQTIYRAAQEGLTNAHKHGAARQVNLSLEYRPEAVKLIVRDNGSAAPKSTASSGFGLAGLHERAIQLGGWLSASPITTGGYRLIIELPSERS